MKYIIITLLLGLVACNSKEIKEMIKDEKPESLKVINYLALGDSYTIGEGVGEEMRFPVQLIETLDSIDRDQSDLQIIATTGWTTRNLLDAMEQAPLEVGKYDFITLLIGVNNQYQGRPLEEYRSELRLLIDKSLQLLQGDNDRLILVSIPDYGVTPFGQSRDSEVVAREIDAFNAVKEAFAKEYEVPYAYITDLTKKAKDDLTLLASDQLHPSGILYAQWVERIKPLAQAIINNR